MSREASIDYTALQIITCLPGVMSFHALPHLVAKLFYVRKKSEQLYFFFFLFFIYDQGEQNAKNTTSCNRIVPNCLCY